VKYQLNKRADREDETRRRIVEAAVSLHAELGPSRTSILALSQRAGVSRPTIYRHFRDQQSLLAACSSHTRALNPPPALAAWEEIADPEQRLAIALEQLFEYYAANENILVHVHHDAEHDPVVRAVSEPRRRYTAEAGSILARPWNVRGAKKRKLRAAIAHAIAFSTWRSLVREEGLREREAITLLTSFVRAAAG